MWMGGKLALWLLVSSAHALCSAVLQLGNGTFLAHLEANPLVLVDCSEPCQSLQPELETVAEVLKKKDISVVSINCTAEAKLCSSYNVTSYPALRIFRSPNNFARFRGRRIAKTIISYMIRQTLPLISVVTERNIVELRSLDMPLVIAFMDTDDSESSKLFESIVDSHHDNFLFGISSDIILAKACGVKPPVITIHSALDHIDRVFSKTFTIDKIEEFLNGVSTPLIGKFSLETYYEYTQSELPLAHIFARTEAERQSLAELLARTAERYRDEIHFATIDADAYGFFAGTLGLTPGQFPAFVIEDVQTGDSAAFNQNEQITAEGISAFVQNYVTVRRNSHVASEEASHDEL